MNAIKNEQVQQARANIPDAAFDLPLHYLSLSAQIIRLLDDSGYSTVGDLMLQVAVDPDIIRAIRNIGPRSMESIEEALAAFELPSMEEGKPLSEKEADVMVPDEEAVPKAAAGKKKRGKKSQPAKKKQGKKKKEKKMKKKKEEKKKAEKKKLKKEKAKKAALKKEKKKVEKKKKDKKKSKKGKKK